jgi:serine/threonine protein phosphatase PrpC
VRRHNEDRSLARPGVLAVADGMGGALAGEVAAQVAVEAVAGLAAPVTAEDVGQALQEANRAIRRMAAEDPDKTGMGTTLTAALLAADRLDVVHVGDSRAYLWRDRELRQLTEDHSVVAELVRRGSLSAEDAEHHPHRNVITRALGAEPEVVADTVSEPLRDGDVVLLCSDGLSSYVPERDIAAVLAAAGTLREAAAALVERANAAGGTDNVTVVLARAGPAPAEGGGTAESTLPEGQGTGPRTAEMRVLGGVHGHAGMERGGPAARPPRVLEPVPRRRSRVRGILVGVVVALVAAAGILVWVASRNYTLEEAPDGTVRVMHGLPVSVAGLDLEAPWQDTGVPAAAVRAEQPRVFSSSWTQGQGDAVRRAADLVWHYGLPPVPTIEPPPVRPPAPAAGEATPETSAP